ncbi:MAG: DNA polymerase III subunit gamma/tau [Thermoguttaceae bacterium]
MMTEELEQNVPLHVESAQGYQVVARRYRPKEFQELIGQHHVSQALSNAITTERVGHAYLFTGARGVGKTSTARIFAKSLNCVHGPTTTPCHVCDICESISVGEDIDVLEIDGASNRGIDEIRSLRQNTSIRPSRARFKIYIIDEVHMLTREAFNALLKTLEEPPNHVKFIFCTTEANKIPITILSRCQRFDFAGIDSTEIAEKLAQIATAEKVTADEGVFETLARRAAGSMRDAQSLLEQLLSFAPEHIRINDVHEMLGTADDQRVFRLLESLLNCETTQIFEELDQLSSEGVDYGLFLEQIMGAFRDLMVVAAGSGTGSGVGSGTRLSTNSGSSSGTDSAIRSSAANRTERKGETTGGPLSAVAKLLLYTSPSRLDWLSELAQSFGIQRILAALQILDQTHNRMRFSTQSRILAELAFVRIAHLGQMQTLAVLLDQLKKGELQLPGPSIAGLSTAQSAQSSSLGTGQVQGQRGTAGPSSSSSSNPSHASDPSPSSGPSPLSNSTARNSTQTVRKVHYVGTPESVQPIQHPDELRQMGLGRSGLSEQTGCSTRDGLKSLAQNGLTQNTLTQNTPIQNRPIQNLSGQRAQDVCVETLSQRPVDVATNRVRFDLGTVDPQKATEIATEIWQETAQSLGGVLAGFAQTFHSVRLEQPNLLIVTFPITPDNKQSAAKTYCDKETAKILSVLEQLTGTRLQVRFDLIERGSAQPTQTMISPGQKARMKQQLIAELSDHPIVLRATELFGAEIVDVRD